MAYDLYNINDKIIIKSDKKVGFLSKNPQHELEVSGSTWAQNVTGINFSGTTGFFNILKIKDPVEVEYLNVEKINYKTINFQNINLFAQNINANNFYLNYITGVNFNFNLISGNANGTQIKSLNVYSNILKGKIFETDGIKFLDKKNKILTNNSTFPFTVTAEFKTSSLDSETPLPDQATVTATLNGSSTAGFINIEMVSGRRGRSLQEELEGITNSFNFFNYEITFNYNGIYSSIENLNVGPRKPTILISPGSKNAGRFVNQKTEEIFFKGNYINVSENIKFEPGETSFKLIFNDVYSTGPFTPLDGGYMSVYNVKDFGKWYYMIIG